MSSNHNRDLERCLAFIDKAAEIGCDAVKFQLFRIEELFAAEVLEQSEEHRQRKAWELPVEFLPALAARCRERDILFGCTPFYLDAVDELLPHVDFFKVASYELMWDDLLMACGQTGKPLVLSTGMATMDEIRHAVGVVSEHGSMGVSACAERDHAANQPVRNSDTSTLPHPLTLLHCVSGYPTPPDQCNLAAIHTLRKEFSSTTQLSGVIPHPSLSIGWSDHSVNPDVVRRAVQRWDASMIEFHLDLDGTGAEYGAGHCWLPEQIEPVIAEVRRAGAEGGNLKPEVGESGAGPQLSGFIPHPFLSMDGTGIKQPAPAELPDREWRADPSDGLRPLKAFRPSLGLSLCDAEKRADDG